MALVDSKFRPKLWNTLYIIYISTRFFFLLPKFLR